MCLEVVAVCCSMLQYVAVCCSLLQPVAVFSAELLVLIIMNYFMMCMEFLWFANEKRPMYMKRDLELYMGKETYKCKKTPRLYM